MPEHEELSEASWDRLLSFLDPDRHARQGPDRDAEAEARYLEITKKLVCFFAGRGCRDAEDLAMTTTLRVAARCRSVDGAGFADRTGYFFGVARNVLHEAHRDHQRDARRAELLKRELPGLDLPGPEAWQEEDVAERCLDRCLALLTSRARRLITSYYSGEGWQKVEGHRALADQFGKSLNALRIEVHRVRKSLRQCVFDCLSAGAADARPVRPPARTASVS